MEKQQLQTITTASSLAPEEAIASFNPLLQPFHGEQVDSYYNHEHLPVLHILSTDVAEHNNITNVNKNDNLFIKCFYHLEKFSGIIYALLAALLFSCSNFIIQQLDVTLLDVFLVRFFFQGIISLSFIIYKSYHPFTNGNGQLIFIRSLIAGIGSVCFYIGLELLPLSDLMTLRYTQVVWTSLLALILFRERITLPIMIASLLTLMGVIGVTQPAFLFMKSKIVNETLSTSLTKIYDQRTHGVFVALSCAFSISMGVVLNKRLMERKVRQSIILFHFILTTFTMLLILQTYYWGFSQKNIKKFNIKNIYLTKNFVYATILATLQLIPMVLSQKSIKREHPSVFTVVQASDILFSIVLQNMFSKIKSNLYALLGSTLVLTSIVIVGTHKLLQDRKNRSHLTIPFKESQ